jgi:Xaa-Pro aminopeptidase
MSGGAVTTTKTASGFRVRPPRFSLAERDRRFSAVRAAMRAHGFACLIFPPNTGDWDNYQPDLRYLSCIGGGGMAAALVFPLDGDPIAGVREARRVEWWRASQDWISDVRSPPGFRWSQFFAAALRELGAAEGRIGVVGLAGVLRAPEGTVSYGEMLALFEELPRARFESATELMYGVRKRKSVEEIAITEEAQRCADAISAALRASARPGATEHDVYAAMLDADVRAGGEVPAMILIGAESRMWQTQLQPAFRELEHDDIVIVEAEPKYFGYMAQAVDTVSLRPLTSLERRLLDASLDCFEALLAAMLPGVAYSALIQQWESFARRAGCQAGRTMGHGLGLGQDGPLTTRNGRAGDLIVEDGDCFVLKPWMANEDDTVSGRVGGTVVVENGFARKLGKAALAPLVLA